MTPLTDFPAENAPLSEWLRPLSATVRNRREMPTCSTAVTGTPASNGGIGARLAAAQRRAAAPQEPRKQANPRRAHSGPHDATVRRMALIGAPVTEIAAAIGSGRGTVSKVIRRLGLLDAWNAARGRG